MVVLNILPARLSARFPEFPEHQALRSLRKRIGWGLWKRASPDMQATCRSQAIARLGAEDDEG
eukprot:9251973-Alexandrium_andersonii.AAC.1